MKTWKRALALVLALVMALSLVALPSFAAGEGDSAGNGSPRVVYEGASGENNGGLVMSKTVTKGEGDDQFLLTLEAFATGTTRTDTKEIPLDIVLVLDTSSSMSRDFDGNIWDVADKDRRLTALKTAVNNFAESVAAKAKGSDGQYGGEDDVNYRIAVVEFASEAYNLTNGLVDMDTSRGLTQVKNAVSGLQAGGDTYPATGLDMANSIFDANPISGDGQRGRVVIMFTDGYPAENGTDNINYTLCDNAIASAQTSKRTYGATVYTVGIFSGANPNSNIDTNFDYGNRRDAEKQLVAANRYMHYTSSNFQNAKSLRDGGEKSGSSYYLAASNANSLNDVFKSISQTIGSTPVELTRTSVLRDVISDSFTLPEGYTDGDIKAYSVSCESSTKNADGTYTYTWKTTPDADKYDVTVADDNKTINVTDFDYAANWVDQYDVGGSKSHGKKLVVEIPIVLDPDATGSVDTNGPASGIYASADAETAFANFKTPTVYVPFFTVAHVESCVNDQGKNFGQETGRKGYPLWCYKEFNLTSVVTANHLYGGTFNEETCTTVHKDVQEQGNPMELNPTENATYYIWEVPDTYLRPFAFWVSSHQPKGWTVTQMYLLSEVDRLLYRDAGLYVKFGDNEGTYISSNCSELTEGTDVNNNNKATVYQRLEYFKEPNLKDVVETWYLQKGKVKKQEVGLTLNENANPTDSQGQVVDDGYITGHRLLGNEFTDFQNQVPVTYKAYWVTLDGVHVEGVRSRTYTFQENQHDPAKNPDSGKRIEPVYKYVENVSTQTTLALRASMLVNESEPAVENVNVTVVDAAKTYELTVSAGTGVRDQVAYQAPAGKVFAGWFADQAYTTPADLDQVTQDTTIYAKYVSDSYLDLAYSRIGLFRLRGVTLISAVDNPANYQASGIMVNGQKLDVSYASRYRIFKTPANLFGAARDAKLMLADKSLSGTGDLEVTPYWITLDGTEVHGSAHTLHYNTRTIWE
ncbi:VWA domain-containing protein [Oscillospiraceae bacterium CLA-AA-H272]|uniref:VWA domain-containing protein n=1 Tax=Brotocaccenecus cirricatena TaxID=3064195 RepID=A0AAE3AIR9_9FIRM|nr:vWA domain-containing protein [Brotocaccenecus cirricatena]MCC2131080.1 VWA domain-containing protein [Brotocaccenecus cirricatena]